MTWLELLVKVGAGFVFGGTVLVALQHLILFAKLPNGRLLPLHVGAIALSYDLLLLALLTRPLDWRAVLYIPALLLGGVALIVMFHFQRTRSRD